MAGVPPPPPAQKISLPLGASSLSGKQQPPNVGLIHAALRPVQKTLVTRAVNGNQPKGGDRSPILGEIPYWLKSSVVDGSDPKRNTLLSQAQFTQAEAFLIRHDAKQEYLAFTGAVHSGRGIPYKA